MPSMKVGSNLTKSIKSCYSHTLHLKNRVPSSIGLLPPLLTRSPPNQKDSKLTSLLVTIKCQRNS